MNKNKVIALSVMMTALLSSQVWASNKNDAAVKPSSSNLAEQQEQMQKVKVIDEAVKVLEQTSTALQQLDKGKKKEALDTLALIIGKLELITTQHPDLALAPVDVQMVVHDYVGTSDTVKAIRKQARKLLNDGKIQQARHLLKDVASEVVVRTTNLPLLTYPDLMKSIVPMIDEGKISLAKEVLQRSLSTVVVVDDIIPLPVLRAQTALSEAKTLAKQENRDEKASKLLKDLLKEARAQLEWAQTLGYGDRGSFDALYDSLSKIEKKTKHGGQEQSLFDDLKSSIKKLIQGQS